MVPWHRAQVSFISSNHFSICSGLAAIFNEKFQAIGGHISEMLRDRANYCH